MLLAGQILMMKYSTEVIVDLPRKRVVELFDNVENTYLWQPGLKAVRVLEGTSGKAGCKSQLIYEGRKGDLVMTEEILTSNLPEEYHALYKARGIHNEIYNYFQSLEGGKTLWKTENIFRFQGMMAIFSRFMKPGFKSQTLLSMERFKTFAENNS